MFQNFIVHSVSKSLKYISLLYRNICYNFYNWTLWKKENYGLTIHYICNMYLIFNHCYWKVSLYGILAIRQLSKYFIQFFFFIFQSNIYDVHSFPSKRNNSWSFSSCLRLHSRSMLYFILLLIEFYYKYTCMLNQINF